MATQANFQPRKGLWEWGTERGGVHHLSQAEQQQLHHWSPSPCATRTYEFYRHVWLPVSGSGFQLRSSTSSAGSDPPPPTQQQSQKQQQQGVGGIKADSPTREDWRSSRPGGAATKQRPQPCSTSEEKAYR